MFKVFLLVYILIVIGCNTQENEKLISENTQLRKALDELKASYETRLDSIASLNQEKSGNIFEEADEMSVLRALARKFHKNYIESNHRPEFVKNESGLVLLNLPDFEKQLVDSRLFTNNFIQNIRQNCSSCLSALEAEEIRELDEYNEPAKCSFIRHSNFWIKSQEGFTNGLIDSMQLSNKSATAVVILLRKSDSVYIEIAKVALDLKKSQEVWKIDKYSLI